jgi:hypothetical protein
VAETRRPDALAGDVDDLAVDADASTLASQAG